MITLLTILIRFIWIWLFIGVMFVWYLMSTRNEEFKNKFDIFYEEINDDENCKISKGFCIFTLCVSAPIAIIAIIINSIKQ